ncbi:hypothetical protein BDV18DRAFT_145586 [Aspergillus unguis]
MSSYFSSITSSSAISNLGTRLNSLRRAITSDEADDPDNEDCSHISNVLRAYYTEKGRRYPSWLPPDPKERASTPARQIATSNSAAASMSSGRGGSLGDLWGDSNAGSAPVPQTQTASLRRGRGHPTSTSSASSLPSQSSPALSGSMSSPSLHPAGARPQPGGHATSFGSTGSAGSIGSGPSPGPGGGGLERATSAQERLRARLHGGRSPSPGQLGDPSLRKPVGYQQGPSRFR